MKNPLPFLGGVITLSLLVAGCKTEAPPAKAPKTPDVTICQPLSLVMPDYEFTGELQAIESVEVRARIGGYLKKTDIKEGQEVKQGDLLFQIDPDTYELAVDRAKADLERAKKESIYADAEGKRAKQLLTTKAISVSDYDKTIATQGVKEADVVTSTVALKNAELNLSYTKVVAPISGKVSRKMVTEGNLISAGSDKATLLTNIVSVDKIYAVFYVDEREIQLFNKDRGKADGKLPSVKVTLSLNTDNDEYPYQGTVDFVDNQVDPGTGTLLVRAIFDNPNRKLIPGYTVRLRIYVGDAKPSLVISERALLADKEGDFVYIVADKKAERKNVKLGRKSGTLIAVTAGLTKDDWVILYGLQRVQPGIAVTARQIPMPGVIVETKK